MISSDIKNSVSFQALDKIINKSRVHLYKPIQIAEILFFDRTRSQVVFSDLESYRNLSKGWRDQVTQRLIGSICTSSQKFQDDLFNDNAMPPHLLSDLSHYNRREAGCIEEYIYQKLSERHQQLSDAMVYCRAVDPSKFDVNEFMNRFRSDPGLKRSIDKVYEIVVYALFTVLVESLNISITVHVDQSRMDILKEFDDFARTVIGLSVSSGSFTSPARLYRVGVTNAADRGLDMWANFGPAVQVKHLSLDESMAERITESITADRIVIVCRDCEKNIIVSLLNQIGWKARIQGIVTESDLKTWYDRAMRGCYANLLSERLLQILVGQFGDEFPSTLDNGLISFMQERGYRIGLYL